ncbi:MAG: ATP-binding cassette domain-containing protein, partial [Pyramidobacter sp.]|nr:ATP-binding cassette domain-containing protein [Pyramidobacter sp.]
MSEILLEVKDLHIHYATDEGVVKALNGASIAIREGKTLGLVGETGAGKSTLARGVLRLVPDPPGKIVGGEILFEGRDLLKISEEDMKKVRGRDIS